MFVLVVKPDRVVSALSIIRADFGNFRGVVFDGDTRTFVNIVEEEIIGTLHPSCSFTRYRSNVLIGPKEMIAELEKAVATINRLMPGREELRPSKTTLL